MPGGFRSRGAWGDWEDRKPSRSPATLPRAPQQEALEGAAEFMGDAPGAAVQSCVPTIKAKTAQKKVVFVPPAPK